MTTTSWSLTIPMPPSVNNLFPSVNGKRVPSKQYRQWKEEADACLWQAPKPLPKFTGRVTVALSFGKTKGLSDVDGRIKAPLDWLVRHQIIVNDDSRYVRRVTAECSYTLHDRAVVT